jgi:hypothetical protein
MREDGHNRRRDDLIKDSPCPRPVEGALAHPSVFGRARQAFHARSSQPLLDGSGSATAGLV